ncbi:MAG: PTS fructose transporter subunit IIA [Aerococcaceae bacterium]|nr:PTS fructose transporter subunit IIA [Aerococcaceae bacterium]
MFKIIIATHGEMSTGIKDAVSTIVGTDGNIETLRLTSGKNVDELSAEYLEILRSEACDEGALIFTDLISASPYNQALLAINHLEDSRRNNVFIIGGVNLPMVLEAVNHNFLNSNIAEVVEIIANQGKEGISIWSTQLLADNDEDEDDDF